MELKKAAVAGTLESGDVQVKIEPAASGADGASGGLTVTIESVVINQYGRRIKEVTLQTLSQLGVANAQISLTDKGALDCTIRARVECAAYRAAEYEDGIPWAGAAHEK